MSHTQEQLLFEKFQSLDDAAKRRLLARMQQALVDQPQTLATWQAQTHTLRDRIAPIADVIDVLVDVRNDASAQ